MIGENKKIDIRKPLKYLLIYMFFLLIFELKNIFTLETRFDNLDVKISNRIRKHIQERQITNPGRQNQITMVFNQRSLTGIAEICDFREDRPT